jgi:hypothetical protein
MNMDFVEPDSVPGTVAHRWLVLESLQEIEAWMDLHDRELRKLLAETAGQKQGQGICFALTHGGEIYLHTNEDGDVMLDVTQAASWVSPVISAATGVAAPSGQYWLLPHASLIPLIMGLNSLIDSSRLVVSHRYKWMR